MDDQQHSSPTLLSAAPYHLVMNAATLFAILALGFAVASPLRAQPVDYEKVLFPLVIAPTDPVPGAFGSLWTTDVAVHNKSQEGVPIGGLYICVFKCSTRVVPPGVTFAMMPQAIATGSFLFIERGKADVLDFALRARDLSRGDESWGTAIPVVRERDFTTGVVNLLDIPTDPRYRLTLRIYSLAPAPHEPVVVRVYELGTVVLSGSYYQRDQLVGEITVLLTAAPVRDYLSDYAIVSDIPRPATGRAVRLEIDAPGADVRIWAFVTLTNNDTQAVTVISP